MTFAWIGIGSNVGDRASFCRQAVSELGSTEGIDVRATSSLYETSPIGGPPQRSYVNAAAKVATSLGARELFTACKDIEVRMGRDDAAMRWGPRVIDLDLLLYGEDKVVEPDLEIPHPRMTERRFVLVPLLEIDPQLADPWGTPYESFLDEAEGDVGLLEDF